MKKTDANLSQEPPIVYVAPPTLDREHAHRRAHELDVEELHWLGRRGYSIGWIGQIANRTPPSLAEAAWSSDTPIVLPQFVAKEVARARSMITTSQQLLHRILDDEDCADIFLTEPYVSRLTPHFELLASSHDESDQQEIETLEFDVVDEEEVVAENIWVKLSWLSYAQDDASLRFRFSFGIVGYEDVASDFPRQAYAGELTEAIFPESEIVSHNERLNETIRHITAVENLAFVERIVYFNAPNGGAQFHQDVERGHIGVVYAQLHGRTAWLALSKSNLITEIKHFITRSDVDQVLSEIIPDRESRQTLYRRAAAATELSAYLDDEENDPLEALINRTPAFTQQLIANGYAYILSPGDVILLPQHSVDRCAWHSVFCLDQFPGQALSFAIRQRPQPRSRDKL